MRAYIYAGLLLLAIFGSIAAYLYQRYSLAAQMDFTPPPVTIAAGTARNATWPSQLEAVGTVRAARGVELSAETSGEVIGIGVRSGEKVAAGQLLLTLNDNVEQASRDRQDTWLPEYSSQSVPESSTATISLSAARGLSERNIGPWSMLSASGRVPW